MLRDVAAERGVDFLHVAGREGTYFLPESMLGGGAFWITTSTGTSTSTWSAAITNMMVKRDPVLTRWPTACTGRSRMATSWTSPSRPAWETPATAWGGRRGCQQRRISRTLRDELRTRCAVSQSRRRDIPGHHGRGRHRQSAVGQFRLLRRLRSRRLARSLRRKLRRLHSVAHVPGVRWASRLLPASHLPWKSRQAVPQRDGATAGRTRGRCCSKTSATRRGLHAAGRPGDGIATTDQRARRQPAGYSAGAGLGIAVTDVNADDWPDIFVANDFNANYLWINGHDGTFNDEAIVRAVRSIRRPGPGQYGNRHG